MSELIWCHCDAPIAAEFRKGKPLCPCDAELIILRSKLAAALAVAAPHLQEYTMRLEEENKELAAALSGRTVSCGNCNEAPDLDRVRDQAKAEAYDEVGKAIQEGLPQIHMTAREVDLLSRLSIKYIAYAAALREK